MTVPILPKIFFPPEWYEQDGVMLTWPHEGTDWASILPEVEHTYVQIAREIIKHEKLILVCENLDAVKRKFTQDESNRILFFQIPSNDTWSRDHGPVFTFEEGKPVANDFEFNGWGNKFDPTFDNKINSRLFNLKSFRPEVSYRSHAGFILEGGSIETDGKGTLLTTAQCLLNKNRNHHLTRSGIEHYLMNALGASRILWLNHGFLEGDDTDSHIDTIARFCDENTICYVQCHDQNDRHFDALKKMEQELLSFRTVNDCPYHLVPLPMVPPLYNESGGRMPATYANFLIMNNVVLLPLYKLKEDLIALEQLKMAFPSREIIGIDCLSLIKQSGSLHCITMQIPKGCIV
jgi:agmatine deiminase